MIIGIYAAVCPATCIPYDVCFIVNGQKKNLFLILVVFARLNYKQIVRP